MILREIRAKVPFGTRRTQTLYWIDILNKRVYANADVLFETDEFIGCIALRRGGGLILTQRFSFWTCESDSPRLTLSVALADEPSNNRFNDGKCDPRGRFLAGTMDMGEKDPNGSLYSFDGKSLAKLLGGVTISNGLTWSPDYTTFYYIDTPTRQDSRHSTMI